MLLLSLQSLVYFYNTLSSALASGDKSWTPNYYLIGISSRWFLHSEVALYPIGNIPAELTILNLFYAAFHITKACLFFFPARLETHFITPTNMEKKKMFIQMNPDEIP